MHTAAIHYHADAFTMDRNDVKGRHAAGFGFLGGVVRHLSTDPIYCYAASRQMAEHCAETVAAAAQPARPVKWIAYGQEGQLGEPGCLFTSGPALGNLAWRRRTLGQRAYSLCGLTHTICSTGVMDAFGDYLVAPLQPWDALICTSRPARAAIEGVLARQAEYLEQRLGAPPRPVPLQLPVIPLGVDCERYAPGADSDARRARFRRHHNIADGDVALLFFGRLSFHAKAHPMAMLVAAERVAKGTARKLHVVFTGRFPNAAIGEQFRVLAKGVAPSVAAHFVDGGDEELAYGSWFGSDIFVSLSDNIQETFGLTPIEAQAAGLPVVVSDWDGYKDTVAEGETGFRVPTLIPPAGSGQELIDQHATEAATYDRYIGRASLCTAVDIGACAEVLRRLVEDSDLRARMGEAGRRRAREHYDWSVVVGQYSALWGELAAIRANAAEIAPPRPGAPAAPLRDDPFRVFGNFASQTLAADMVLRADDGCVPLDTVLAFGANTYAMDDFLAREPLRRLVAALRRQPLSVAQLGGDARLLRSLMWLLKMGVIRRV